MSTVVRTHGVATAVCVTGVDGVQSQILAGLRAMKSRLAALESGRIDPPPSVNVDATQGPNFLGVPAEARPKVLLLLGFAF